MTRDEARRIQVADGVVAVAAAEWWADASDCGCYRLPMERERGFEPSTSTLARLHSTTALLPQRSLRFVAAPRGLSSGVAAPAKKGGSARSEGADLVADQGPVSALTELAPETVLRNYFHAKDETRPHMLECVFEPGAELVVVNLSVLPE